MTVSRLRGQVGRSFLTSTEPWWRLAAWMPPVAWLGIFFGAPLALTFVYSVAYASFGAVTLGFTFVNFQQALSGFYLHIFLHTLEFAVTGTALCLVVGTPVAYTLARR